MEATRPQPLHASLKSGGCRACGQSAPGARCDWCGAAITAGGFRIEQVIAQGPHGRVYRAEDAQGRRVALKELQFAQVPGTREIDAFEREAKTLAELAHPGIPRLLKSFTEGSGVHLRLYLAAELVPGESLQARIARGPLTETQARDVAVQALKILHYLHTRIPAVLHRDVKPDNLILRPDGTLALVDFGSARRISGDRTFGSTLVGTFGYMAPEQLGGTADPTSDLYALGATLLHATTGRPPSEWLHGELELRIPAQVPAGLRPFLEAVLQRDPLARPRTAQGALALLEHPAVEPARGDAKARALLSPGAALERDRRRLALVCMGIFLAVVGVSRGLDVWSDAPVAEQPAASATSGLRYGSPAAKRWFTGIKPRCNALEVEQAIRGSPPPSGWDGAGYAASCYALAGKIDHAGTLLSQVPAEEQARAAAILFELGHPIADLGDDVSAEQIMNLVLRFWPQNYQARYHAGMSEYVLGQPDRAREDLERFLREYRANDGFTQNARATLARIRQGLPSAQRGMSPVEK